MGRLVALDIGRKRTGVAATDLLQIVPNGLGFQPTHEVAQWLKEYAEKEPIDLIVVGEPKQADGTDSESVKYIEPVVNRLRKLCQRWRWYGLTSDLLRCWLKGR